MKKHVIILFLILLTVPGFSQSPGAVVDSANAAYTEGEYYKALSLYDSVYQMGYESASLYYNLGNSYFKTDDIANAILFYERALKLSPQDEDINGNLEMARQLTLDKIEKVPELFYERWWQRMMNTFNMDGWATLFVISLSVFFVALVFFILSKNVWIRKFSFYSGIIIFLVAGLSMIFSLKQQHEVMDETDAIVFKPSVTVKASPDKKSVNLFVIHEGTKVYILDKLGNWYEIKIDNGSVGWIPQETVEVI
ncbi:MAG TPA: tetratricopeptide repeat protein [Bacteroidales bacterium]|nr:tetratricopeptide repeat protein [Bacteroidales bacterium]